nr:unnamed protein product [Digitaria exilis]
MAFWKALDFEKLTGAVMLSMTRCPPMPLDALQRLSSTIKHLVISELNRVNGKDLTQVLACLPKLSYLKIDACEKITGLGVVGEQKEAASSSGEEEEIAPSDELLLLPPQLHDLEIRSCPKLSLRPNSPQGGTGGGLQALSSLRSFTIWYCPKFLSSYSPSSSPSSCFPFPTSLQSLTLYGVETLAPLSNLASLAQLWVESCGGSGGSGLGRLLAHGCLHELSVYSTPNFFSIECSKEDTPEMLEHGSPFPPSCKLQSLETDDIAGVLAAPVCTLLSSSLTSLAFVSNMEMERFTKEQGATLQPLTSLQQLKLSNCSASHPPGLQTLTNLKTLHIRWCRSIRSLPKDNLPNSLRKLTISGCSSIRSLPKDGLPDSLLELEISFCPSIRALPKGGLPSSLQKLDVSYGNSEELTRQCRKLIGTIPIVEV